MTTSETSTEKTVWRERGAPLLAPSDSGPLSGLRLAVKDVYAIAGHRVGAGNPDWLAEAELESTHAWAVGALLDAGAEITGIAQTDELTYSLDGVNAHYGTPPNPQAPGHIPGGSSSGPASAVALHETDAGLGTDTAGSIRVPASYCGLYGMRPTHGAVPVTGMLPLAPDFDTVAWLARDAATLARVGDVLLPPADRTREDHGPFRTALVAPDLLAPAVPQVREAFETAAAGLASRLGLRREVRELGGDPAERAESFSVAQAAQVRECDGAWVAAHPGALGAETRRRFVWAEDVGAERVARARESVSATARALRHLLTPGTVLLLPATPGPAPSREAGAEERSAVRRAALQLTCLASGAGLPCLVLPRMTAGGLPVGLCLIAAPGSDHALLNLGVADSRR
ncbi:Asp-tRNA(Asn)/Glu-tRNA(Gln) amidotransferase A subunit family amidase [Streptomyces sp. Amel2xB2]|uniref:amidase n=1 Tax=Streptomyces sp. Amel2xB2 TaxID=1305829 RepID=UPI000DBABB9A|nr:amidase [Streptomyces sp. Amel2xB2]RAJ68893.1 Asp-tRNA(Asn)/Glu-tRNA(Gln) amidotransferase A subunit family amidase [Streptomyces sp. Amel2xB2]